MRKKKHTYILLFKGIKNSHWFDDCMFDDNNDGGDNGDDEPKERKRKNTYKNNNKHDTHTLYL